MKNYNFDGHKLIYHTERVSEFLTTGDCYPIYMEISPVGKCNHRCIFCAYDFIGYPNRKLETEKTLHLINELAECGLKSLLFAGEGEPLLHPDISSFILHAWEKKIDCGLFTNGQLLSEKLAGEILPALTFVRFSFNGGSDENYAQIHQVKSGVFFSVLKNIRKAVQIKKKNNLAVDIGAQFVLIRENMDSLVPAGKILKEAGADYLVIKPFVQQNDSQHYHQSKHPAPGFFDSVLAEAEKISSEDFKVIARKNAFENYGVRNYSHCLGTSFISVLNSAGDIATCLPYWDKKEFVFGNIHEESFKKIWHGPQREKLKKLLENNLEVGKCPPNCRPNVINDFLFELKNPTINHINFI